MDIDRWYTSQQPLYLYILYQKDIVAEGGSSPTLSAYQLVAQDDAQRDLDEALPALDQAVECLKKLKKAMGFLWFLCCDPE